MPKERSMRALLKSMIALVACLDKIEKWEAQIVQLKEELPGLMETMNKEQKEHEDASE